MYDGTVNKTTHTHALHLNIHTKHTDKQNMQTHISQHAKTKTMRHNVQPIQKSEQIPFFFSKKKRNKNKMDCKYVHLF